VTKEVVGSDNDASSRQVARYVAERAPVYVPIPGAHGLPESRFLRGGDHKAFNDLGFAAALSPNRTKTGRAASASEGVDGKRFGDTPDRLDPAYMERVAAVNLAALDAAFAPPAPRDVRVDVLELGPHTTLRWRAEASVDRVAILTRPPADVDGTAFAAKGATEATLEGFSKDDWLFAVEGVDGAGRRSLPVYPTDGAPAAALTIKLRGRRRFEILERDDLRGVALLRFDRGDRGGPLPTTPGDQFDLARDRGMPLR
jgi:hypothetical protein